MPSYSLPLLDCGVGDLEHLSSAREAHSHGLGGDAEYVRRLLGGESLCKSKNQADRVLRAHSAESGPHTLSLWKRILVAAAGEARLITRRVAPGEPADHLATTEHVPKAVGGDAVQPGCDI